MTTPPVSSRLARKEHKKVLKQTVWFGAGAVVLFLLFLFLLLPGLTDLALGIFGAKTDGGLEDTLPPQVPVFELTQTHSKQQTHTIKGYGEPQSKVVVLLDETEVQQVTADDAGDFSFELRLTEGEHTLTTYSIDGAGNESKVSKPYTLAIDTKKPTIELEEPKDGESRQGRQNQAMTIRGTTEPNAKVYINGRLVLARSDGTFTTTYQLQEGGNPLEFKIVDQAGNETELKMAVTFSF